MGLATHAMGGFSADAAREVLRLPEHLEPEVVIAVGWRGDAATLPDDLREREGPSPRKPLAELSGAAPGPPAAGRGVPCPPPRSGRARAGPPGPPPCPGARASARPALRRPPC